MCAHDIGTGRRMAFENTKNAVNNACRSHLLGAW